MLECIKVGGTPIEISQFYKHYGLRIKCLVFRQMQLTTVLIHFEGKAPRKDYSSHRGM